MRSPTDVPPAPPDRAVQLADLRNRVGVLLGEADPRAHVQHVTHRRAAVARLLELWHILRHQAFRVEVAALNQDGGHTSHDGLAQRQQRVRALRVAALAVPLKHNTAVLQNHTRIGVGVGQDRGNPRRRTVDPVHLKGADIHRFGHHGQRTRNVRPANQLVVGQRKSCVRRG